MAEEEPLDVTALSGLERQQTAAAGRRASRRFGWTRVFALAFVLFTGIAVPDFDSFEAHDAPLVAVTR